jgi:hypothetical protein
MFQRGTQKPQRVEKRAWVRLARRAKRMRGRDRRAWLSSGPVTPSHPDNSAHKKPFAHEGERLAFRSLTHRLNSSQVDADCSRNHQLAARRRTLEEATTKPSSHRTNSYPACFPVPGAIRLAPGPRPVYEPCCQRMVRKHLMVTVAAVQQGSPERAAARAGSAAQQASPLPAFAQQASAPQAFAPQAAAPA